MVLEKILKLLFTQIFRPNRFNLLIEVNANKITEEAPILTFEKVLSNCVGVVLLSTLNLYSICKKYTEAKRDIEENIINIKNVIRFLPH